MFRKSNTQSLNINEVRKEMRLDVARQFEWSIPEEKSASAYSLPVFGIRQRMLEYHNLSASKICAELTKDYHLAIFSATIKALGCDVIEIAPDARPIRRSGAPPISPPQIGYAYVRDPVVVIEDLDLIISTKKNEHYSSKSIINKLKEIKKYKHQLIEHAYFEGGNVICVPFLKTILHGLHPESHYVKEDASTYLTSSREDYYEIDPILTNQRLKEALSQYGIDVLGLELCDEVIAHNNGCTREDYYYHLDCFMQLLPDGHLLILNKKILSDDAQRRLEKLFGDKIIDLAYSGYLTEPTILNFVTIPKDNNFIFVSSFLPESVIENISKLGYSLITPHSLDVRHNKYNKELSKRVSEVLRAEGYTEAKDNNLATYFPINDHGYLLDDGRKIDFEALNTRIPNMQQFINEYYCEHPVSFVYGGGGPHCLTTEIISSKSKSPALDNAVRHSANSRVFSV